MPAISAGARRQLIGVRTMPVLAAAKRTSQKVATLRAAYHAAMNDPGFIADAANIRIDISEVSSDRLYQQISRAYAMPADVVSSARDAMNLTGSR